jgi:cholest-4-en-3-one 26-monooxygenase
MQLRDVDLTDPDIFEQATPHDMFTLLRRESPVHWHEEKDGPGFWAITKHADLKFISKKPELFSSAAKGTLASDPPEETLGLIRNIMLNMDPPQHRQYRNLINKAFTPRMVNGLLGHVRGVVRNIINGVIEKGECDFVEEVAAILPMEVICQMMGVPQEDRRSVYEIGNSMVGFDDPELQADGKPLQLTNTSAAEAFGKMFVYANKLRDKAKKHPSDDLATALLSAEIDGQRLSESDFNYFFLLLLIAGNETTRTVTSNGMIALLRNPAQHAALQTDLSLIDSAVEEILRFDPAVHTFRRQAMADVELRDKKINEGDKVMLWYPSVNRDEEVFERPHDFDIRRSPNDHLSFGIGEHYCLGANLARMELQEIFRGIATHLHEMEMAAPPRRLRSTFINGVKEMRVRFRPGAPIGA